ncbi:hypothetical protein HRbin11_00763 [bacterium HR11]|nr:hypothetical protein HRbin11_00763 [bacterium HR11]
MKRTFSLLTLLVVSLWLSGQSMRSAYAAVYIVTSLADNTNNDFQCTLREAILAANNTPANADCFAGSPDDDTIIFITGGGTITLGSTLPNIVSGAGTLTINGGGTIAISGGGSVRVMVVNSGANLTLQNITIANGKGSSFDYGGGISNAGTVTVTNSTFAGNSAHILGGGIYNVGVMKIINSTFAGNSATGGGAIRNNSILTVINSTFAGNSAGSGGAIENVGTITMTNCTVSGNSAGAGGGILNAGTLTMTNCTVSGNTSSGGGGIHNVGTLNLNNSIVANNVSNGGHPDIDGPVSSGDFNLIKDTTGTSLPPGSTHYITGQDPKLLPLGNYGGPTQTHALLGNSPAIDRGSNDLAKDPDGNPLTTDQRGSARVVNNTVDMGASEANIFLSPTSLPFAIIGQNYNQSISAVGGTSPYNFSLASGSNLPNGLSLSTGGVISGTPDQAGIFVFTVVAKDQGGFVGSYEYVLGVGNLRTVSSTSDASNCSQCLRGEIAAAGDGDTIQITVTGTITLDSTLGELLIDKNLAIVGPGADQLTVSGNNATRVFNISSGKTVQISGLTIANGLTSFDSGGGILNAGTLTMTNCTVSGNIAGGAGGGISNSGTLTMTNCTVSENGTGSGGGGGGIYNDGTLTMKNCTVSGNSAGGGSGGISNNKGTLTMENCTVSGNSVVYVAGGISNSGVLTMTNCTVSGNSAGGYGGGIANAKTGFGSWATLRMTNCTVSGNSAGIRGGGIDLTSGMVTLKNTIIANSTSGGDCGQLGGTVDPTSKNNLIEDSAHACGLVNGVNGNVIGVDPMLGTPTGSPAYFPLNPDSPAIDAGDNTTCNNVPVNNQSQNGVTRPQDGDGDGVAVCDIGSYEAPPPLAGTGLAIAGDPDGNGVWDSGEAVTVVPAWRNNDNTSHILNGNASNVVDPPGVVASLTDAAAAYGTIPAGGTADCQTATGDCYAITGTRTGTGHRDVTFDETVSVVGSGSQPPKTWTLHIGPSFADVAPNVFYYKAVETLLHRGVTGGCTASDYCPLQTVNRAQMAIFISRAVLGTDPPLSGSGPGGSWDCTDNATNHFTDVPDGVFYCPHVHWMWANNIAGGCTATTYCPLDPVNRAQMAIFISRAVLGTDPPLSGSGPGGSWDCTDSAPNHFTDVPDGVFYCRHVHWMWANNVTGGCTATTYCPLDPVNRAQMAVFITRAFNLLLYGP